MNGKRWQWWVAGLVAMLAFQSLPVTAATKWEGVLREGDIVFTGSPAGQGAAITAATGSPLTHCGVVFLKDGSLMVLEAVQPVRVVPLDVFMRGGAADRFTVRRLRHMPAPAALEEARRWAAGQVGRNYDSRFEWGDDRLYCSELVWKIFSKAGVELCPLRNPADYNLSHPEVRRLLEARYGSIERLDRNMKIVAPSDLAASSLLDEVKPS